MTTAPLFALLLAASTRTTARLDPCALLDAQAIEAAQGALPKETKASEHPDAQLVSQQCFFTLPDAARSVSLEVNLPGPTGGGKALRERWRKITGEEKQREREEKERERRGSKAQKPTARGGEEEEEGRPPRKIPGVGRPAVWTGSARAGALYVFDKKGIVRLSVGGKGTEDEKIKSSSALAKNALKHLARLQ